MYGLKEGQRVKTFGFVGPGTIVKVVKLKFQSREEDEYYVIELDEGTFVQKGTAFVTTVIVHPTNISIVNPSEE